MRVDRHVPRLGQREGQTGVVPMSVREQKSPRVALQRQTGPRLPQPRTALPVGSVTRTTPPEPSMKDVRKLIGSQPTSGAMRVILILERLSCYNLESSPRLSIRGSRNR